MIKTDRRCNWVDLTGVPRGKLPLKATVRLPGAAADTFARVVVNTRNVPLMGHGDIDVKKVTYALAGEIIIGVTAVVLGWAYMIRPMMDA